MVVGAHKTPRRLVEEALNLMDQAKLIGLVFNYDDHALPGYYDYYYTYSASGQLNHSWWSRLATTVGRLFSR